jgi:hypothetical protein
MQGLHWAKSMMHPAVDTAHRQWCDVILQGQAPLHVTRHLQQLFQLVLIVGVHYISGRLQAQQHPAHTPPSAYTAALLVIYLL